MSNELSRPQVKLRVRDTCITSCMYFPDLRVAAEEEQIKIDAAKEAGKSLVGSSVKVVCPHDATKVCSGFIYVPEIHEASDGSDSQPS